MLRGSGDNNGLLYRISKELFSLIESGEKYKVGISIYCIYGEDIIDLISADQMKKLQISRVE